MPVIEVNETIALDASAGVRFTREGYLVAMPRVARSGIQVYRGDEMGRPAMAQVRVYRPEAEVFSKDSLGSYAHRPVTNDHPPEPVTADNWKKYAAGQTGDEVVRDGNHVRVPMVLMDAQAIKDYRDGKRELSQGYAMDLHWEAGKTKDGEEYDALMKTIRQNHLALVKRARGGPELRIGDDWRIAFDQFCDEFEKAKQGDSDMSDVKTTSIMIGDQAVQVQDISAPHVLRTITGLQTELGELRSKMEKDKEKTKAELDEEKKKGKDALDALTSTKDAEITTIKDQLEKVKLTPAALDALVMERVAVTTQAKALLGDRAPKSFVDKTVQDIRRLAVDAILGDKAKGWDDNAVSASFTALASQTKDAGNDPIRQTFQSHDHSSGNAVEKAWADMVKDTSEAWRSKPAN